MMFLATSPCFGFLFGPALLQILTTAGVGAAVVSIPIIIHLLNRRRYRIVQWAAMRFLLAAQRQQSRRMRLEQLILLLVRVAMVLLLVLAMASVMDWAEKAWAVLWPDGDIGHTADLATHKILVLDGSFSMAARVNGTSCFEKARTLARQIVADAGPGDSFSVVLMAAPPQRVVPGPSDAGARVIDALTGVRLPHGNADLPGTLNVVEDMLRQSPQQFERKEVYFLTDLQRSTWIASRSEGIRPVLDRIKRLGQTFMIDVGQDGLGNLAVTSIGVLDPPAGTRAETTINATVRNYGAEATEPARASLWVAPAGGGGELRRVQNHTPITIPKGGETTLSFHYRFTDPGDYAVQVRLEDDALDVDNARSVVITVADRIPFLLVNGRPAARPVDRATECLNTSLSPFRGEVPEEYPLRTRVVSDDEFRRMSLASLAPYATLFFCDVPQFTPEVVQRIEAHVRNGGGAVFFAGSQVDVGNYNRLLYRDGNGLLPAELKEKRQAPADGTFHLDIENDSIGTAVQPPLQAFSADDRLGLRLVRFEQYLHAEPVRRGAPRKVLSFKFAGPGDKRPAPDGEPAVIEWQPLWARDASPDGEPAVPTRCRGRVVLVTSTANTEWNTWAGSPTYLPFMQELARFASSGRLREHALLVGEPLEEVLTTPSKSVSFGLYTPGSTRPVELAPRDLDENSILRWSDTSLSGIYRIAVANPSARKGADGRESPNELLFAVNVPTSSDGFEASESDLTRTSTGELRETYPNWPIQVAQDPARVVHQAVESAETGTPETPSQPEQAERGKYIARWLLLLVLLLFFTEVVLAWLFGHYSSVPTNQPPARGWFLPTLFGVSAAIVFVVGTGLLLHGIWTGDFLSFLPDSARLAAERAMNVPPPPPGEGTHWQLDFLPFLWGPGTDVWLAGLLSLGGGVLIVGIYLLEGPTASRGYKLLLAGISFVFLQMLLGVFLPQVRLTFGRQSRPDVVLLIDDSLSMSTIDNYQDPAVQSAANELAEIGGLTRQERIQLAKALLTRPGADWPSRLLNEKKFRVHVYHCSARAHHLRDVTGPAEIEPALQAIRELSADPAHDSTELSTAVRQVLKDYKGSPLTAIVLLTDGVATPPNKDLAKVVGEAQEQRVPLFFVGLGDAHPARDLALTDVRVADAVYVKDRLHFEVRVSGHGFDGQRVPIRLQEKGKDEALKEETVEIPAGNAEATVKIEYQPKEAGEKTYVVVLPVQPGEAREDNNRVERRVLVREDKLVRVLYIEGYPRWEYRFIKTLLERESERRKGNKSIQLKVFLQEADPSFASEDRSALSEFPARAELNNYDVVILGDVDPRSDSKMTEHFKDLADFVRERGGGLLVIAGPRFAPHAYRQTALRDVLPIEAVLDSQPPDPPGGRQPYRPELTHGIGDRHPIFLFSGDEQENITIWNQLQEMYFYADGVIARPLAEVLAVHPRRSVRDPATDRQVPLPLAVQQWVGKGRCLYFGFCETWGWRYREYEVRFNQFWVQAVRYLAPRTVERVTVKLDREDIPYRRGDSIRVTVTFPDNAPPPAAETKIELSVRRQTGKGTRPGEVPPRNEPWVEEGTVQLTGEGGGRRVFTGSYTPGATGRYQFTLLMKDQPEPRPQAECLVLAPPGELERLQMNRTGMEDAAAQTGGRFFTLADADQLLDRLPRGSRPERKAAGRVLIWNHLAALTVAMFLVTGVWVLRKRRHLL